MERINIAKIVREIKSNGSNLENENEEFQRLGKYVQEKTWPLKIMFKSLIDAEETLAEANRLEKKKWRSTETPG